MLTKQLDIDDRVTELEDELEAKEDRKQELLTDAKELQDELQALDRKSDEYSQTKRAYTEVEREWDEVEAERVELLGEKRALERCIEDYDGSVYTIRELAYDDWNMLQDRISEASFDFDPETQSVEGHPKEGAFKSMVVNESLEDAPPGAPAEAGSMPRQVCEHLYNAINALNTTGDTDMGNSSLEEALNNSDK